MKAVILAAGAGTRLRPLTDRLPKCLLEVGGKPLLGRALESLAGRGLTEVLCVTGYREERIRRFVSREYPRMRIAFIANPAYASTNNLFSLWLTRRCLKDEEMLLLDSDIFFDPGILDLLLNSSHDDVLAVNRTRPLDREEVKVRVDRDQNVLEIGKELDPALAWGESIGIEKFGRRFVGEVFAEADRLVRSEHRVGIFYEAAFQRLIDRGMHPRAIDTGDLPVVEIDTIDDLELARSILRGPRTP